jgi:hypothetical protein
LDNKQVMRMMPPAPGKPKMLAHVPRLDIPQIRDLGFIIAGRRRLLGQGQARRRLSASAVSAGRLGG